MVSKVILNESNGYIYTKEAEAHQLLNLKIKISDARLIPGIKSFVEHVFSYQVDFNKKIENDETLNYGIWIVKFIEIQDYLEVYELSEDSECFVEGIARAVQTHMEQKYICNDFSVEFDPPYGNSMVTIAKSLDEKDAVFQGIRYIYNKEHSGWLLYKQDEDLENVNEDDLLQMPLYEFLENRFKVSCFFGLPYGFHLIVEEDSYDGELDETLLEN